LKENLNGHLTKAQFIPLLFLARFVSVTYTQELQTSGILSKTIDQGTLITHQTLSLTLKMDFSNISNHCCRFTHAFQPV